MLLMLGESQECGFAVVWTCLLLPVSFAVFHASYKCIVIVACFLKNALFVPNLLNALNASILYDL